MDSAAALSRLFQMLIPLALGACGGGGCSGAASTPPSKSPSDEQGGAAEGAGAAASSGVVADAGGAEGENTAKDNVGASFGEAQQGEASLCEGGTYKPLEGLSLPKDVDYIEYRGQFAHNRAAPARTHASWGEKCKRASDRAACEAAVDAAAPKVGFSALPGRLSVVSMQAPTDDYLVLTQGDKVSVVSTQEELANWLAPLRSVKDAALIAYIYNHGISCNSSQPSTAKRNEDGSYSLTTFVGSTCGAGTSRDQLQVTVSADGKTLRIDKRTVLAKGNPNCVIGRLPNGLCSQVARGASLGSFFAEMAHLEAASVTAFAQIEAELRALSAPESLILQAQKAREDELRHAAAIGAQAQRFGAQVLAPSVLDVPLRDRFAFALDNAMEGCVRETYGALVAAFQCEQATDAEIAKELRIIAQEEAEHAALSWQIAAWIEPQLSAEERAMIVAAKCEVLQALQIGVKKAYAPEVHELAGMPSPAQAAALLAELTPHVARLAA